MINGHFNNTGHITAVRVGGASCAPGVGPALDFKPEDNSRVQLSSSSLYLMDVFPDAYLMQ